MVDLNQYRGNSNASKDIPEREKIQQVASGKKVEETFGKKFISEFIADDIHNIKDYILWDVLLPAFKNAISDTVTNGIDMLLFGQTRSRGYNTVKRLTGTNYNSIYNGVKRITNVTEQQGATNRGLAGYSYKEVELSSRPEAEDVLMHLRMRLDHYGCASVADLYDATGIVPEMIDNKWGWTSLNGAYIQRVPSGYVIKMPRVEPI
ncbi:MAG: hypothetical protein J6Y02_16325 [Pseudobutyrivibrio sp.]|nr:hypothetical protein [Pseudobutyrivibrio sp.]